MRRAVAAALAATVVGLLAGCADNGDSGADGGDTDAGVDVPGVDVPGVDVPGVDLPEVCLTQFLGLTATPDLDEVALPDGWPAPPVEATLCKTENGPSFDEVGYATEASPSEVLDAYAAALAEHGPERTQDDGYGAGTVTGVVDGVTYVVQPRTGSYEIVLGSE